ncbi:hypothetical protein DFH11DRAFT_1541625 [Phellopilus nigrolimitatus]|nr:hypothetical protein DFH11DRAFT_1541625 [Phellopilus nigrolimitatus]
MHLHLLPVSLVALCASAASARAHWSLAEDLYAFPKYRVTFLNGLPVLNDTAERWLKVGLKGGEPEFLDQSWHEPSQESSERLKGIESGDGDGESSEAPEDTSRAHQSPRYQLQRLKMAGKNSYLCMIPPPIESHTKPIEEPQIEGNPAQSWSLLQPLSSSCIYHRQGWFTYAYCHNNQVRQFREIAHSHPHHPGYLPEEDPEWEAYTLGQAATIPSEGHELTSAQQAALTNNVDIVKTAGHRYLTQKWGDGTTCDKTGRPREIEVQFHCSQAMTDSILYVKETSTCHYIMVIHTPRLCAEPGFKTRLEQRDEAFIRCREVVASEEAAAAIDKTLPEAAYPFKRPARQPVLDVPAPPATNTHDSVRAGIDEKTAELVRRAVEALFGGGGGAGAQVRDGADGMHVVAGDEGDVIIEFVDAGDAGETLDKLEERLEELLKGANGKLELVEDALRAAGYEVSSGSQKGTDGDAEQKRKKDGSKGDSRHEEL